MSSSTQIGLIIFDLGLPNKQSLRHMRADFINSTRELQPGRHIIFLWQVSSGFQLSINPEAYLHGLATKAIVEMNENSHLLYFASGALRTYTEKKKLKSTFMWLVYRKQGPKAYKRRTTVAVNTLEKSKIEVSNPIFTRDIANNVWHLPFIGWRREFIARMSTLLAWPDEYLEFHSAATRKKIKRLDINFEKSLIPKAEKKEYEFESSSFH